MKRSIIFSLALVCVAIVMAGCVSAELGYAELEGSNLNLDVIASPDAEIDANYSIIFDPEDPMRTIISIGTTAAKASQVEKARERLEAAMKVTDVPEILNVELAEYFQNRMDMNIVSRREADFTLVLDVREYGIDAGSAGSAIEFVVSGRAFLYQQPGSERIWRQGIHASKAVSPSFFGLPPSAGNVVSAAMLSELSEEEIAKGLDRVAREAAREVGAELERDIYRSRRRR